MKVGDWMICSSWVGASGIDVDVGSTADDSAAAVALIVAVGIETTFSVGESAIDTEDAADSFSRLQPAADIANRTQMIKKRLLWIK